MNIIIAGAGKVGFNLARALSVPHNVTIIDKNSNTLDDIQERLDILPIKGDAEDINIYKNLTNQEIDLFIAVTNNDNINLVSTVVANSVLDIKRKFIRLNSHLVSDEILEQKFAVDRAIFPLELTSNSVSKLLRYPKVNNVKSFRYLSQKLISIRVSKDAEPQVVNSDKIKVVGIERDKEFIIPQDGMAIIPNDLVYFFGDERDILEFAQKIELDNGNEIERCIVFGGGDLGISIAKSLLDAKKEVDVKLIEKDSIQCELANELLGGRVSVLNFKYNSHEVFEDDSVKSADMFIAATNNDEYNIIKCLEAKEVGVRKVVAIHNEMEYYNLMHSLGIVVVRGPKMSTFNTIMEELDSTTVVIQKSYCGGKAVMFMRKIFPESQLIDKHVKAINNEQCKCLLVRENQMLMLEESTGLQESDVIVAFSNSENLDLVRTWINGL